MATPINELKSYTEYNVNAPTSVFTIGFEYTHNVDHINVYVDGVPAATAGYTVNHDTHGTLELNPAVLSGIVLLQRETNIDSTRHEFSAGAKFLASTMDENFEQIRYAQQEVRDGFRALANDLAGQIFNAEVAAAVSAAEAAASASSALNYANAASASTISAASSASTSSAVLSQVTTTANSLAPSISVYSGNGTNKIFTLPYAITNKALIDVYIGGVYQQAATYTIVGQTLTFTNAPTSGTNNIEIKTAANVTYTQPSSQDYGLITQEATSFADYGALV